MTHADPVVFFDLGDVIWDECPAVRHVALLAVHTLATAGVDVSYADWISAYQRSAHAHARGMRTLQTLNLLARNRDISRHVYAALRRDLTEMPFSQFQALHPLRSGIHGVLERLRAVYHLAVLSNQPSRSRTLLEYYGVAPFFSRILLSHEVGLSKPDTRFFRHAREIFGWPARVVMVGNRIDNDIRPARLSGFRTVLYECENALVKERCLAGDDPPDMHVQTVEGLLRLFDILSD